ncbi:hypothetical protein [Mucilaginibacter terrae]|uniref:Uncharacterized protein n=1 Tax=Mucilaginibacter terrae TaxID=1955052 RepID=A0ABU3GYG4_9SPHI|nr:hypothetical protein [Mucilaginibacter terrae]MDT3404695.1 hypothetical protein [Mucilaginibacter terrae]
MFLPHAGQTQVVIASRYEETPVYTIKGHTQPAITVRPYIYESVVAQYSLF